MVVFWIAYSIVIGLYTLFIVNFSIGWISLKTSKKEASPSVSEFTFITAIIVFRNEARHIQQLCKSLFLQSYPASKFEVIFVNDHSGDECFQLVSKEIKHLPGYKLLSLPENLLGKKNALMFGATHARGDLLAFLDADCLPSENWLDELNCFYVSGNYPDLIIGLVDMLPVKTPLQHLFRIEFLSLVISSAGASTFNHAFICNGANLAVKKSEYTSVNLLETKTTSGDDVFLLHDLKRKHKKISVLKSPGHLVLTLPPDNLKEFINQRIRWGSKAKHYIDSDAVFIALLVFFSNIFILIGFALSFWFPTRIVFAGFFLKTIADTILFLCGNKFFKLNFKLFLIPVIELFYPFYLVTTGILSIKKPFVWKGR